MSLLEEDTELFDGDVDETLKISRDLDFRPFQRKQKDFWRSKFIEYGDPQGYYFAEEFVKGGYRKWKKLQFAFYAKKEVGEWKETLEAKLQAGAMIQIAKQKDSFQAQRWLAERGWAEKNDKRTKEAKKHAERVEDEVAGDMERLGLRRVK